MLTVVTRVVMVVMVLMRGSVFLVHCSKILVNSKSSTARIVLFLHPAQQPIRKVSPMACAMDIDDTQSIPCCQSGRKIPFE